MYIAWIGERIGQETTYVVIFYYQPNRSRARDCRTNETRRDDGSWLKKSHDEVGQFDQGGWFILRYVQGGIHIDNSSIGFTAVVDVNGGGTQLLIHLQNIVKDD